MTELVVMADDCTLLASYALSAERPGESEVIVAVQTPVWPAIALAAVLPAAQAPPPPLPSSHHRPMPRLQLRPPRHPRPLPGVWEGWDGGGASLAVSQMVNAI